MRYRTHETRNFTVGILLLALCVLVVLGGGLHLFASEQQAPAPADNYTAQEVAPLHASMQEVMPALPINENQDENQDENQAENQAEYQSEYPVLSDLSINSSNAILVRLGDGETLFDKGAMERIYPASMSKIMTAIVALENLNDLSENILLHNEVFHYITQASVAGFLPGEEVRAIDLLYGLLLPSGAECAIGLAEHIAGSESAFVDLMNGKAQELGMNDTHFANTTGLHDDNHYSTARDMAILLQYAIGNATFYEIFTTARHSTPPTNLHEGGITYYSTLFSKMDSADFSGGSILGGKTGYTDEAGLCLASLAEKGGEQYILVTCGAPGDIWTQELHIDDAFAVYAAIP